MLRSLGDSREWMRHGTEQFVRSVEGCSDLDFEAPSLLPGWTRAHLVAHVAANADAVGNLVHWATTGEQTPMYASAQDRADGIRNGALLPAKQLRMWLRDSGDRLGAAMSALTDEQWRHPVVTAQGRTVLAVEIPWMRAREVNVHAVDLGTGTSFGDLPAPFLESLVEEISDKRGLVSVPDGSLPEVAAWLAGRSHALTDVPELGPWL